MKDAKTFLPILFLFLLALAACSAGESDPPATSSESDPDAFGFSMGVWEEFSSIEELTKRSALVVVGVVGDFVDRFEKYAVDSATGDRIFVKADDAYEFRVERVLGGDSPGGTILIGAADFGTPDENAKGFATGERLLLFLAPIKFGEEVEGWVPLAADSGVFEIQGTRVRARGVVGATADVDTDVESLISQVQAAVSGS